MIDWKKHVRLMAKYRPAAIRCPHCGATTVSASGNSSFCNFCEQRVDTLSSAAIEVSSAEVPFASVLAGMVAGDWKATLESADKLMKGNSRPEQLYLLGIFYRRLSALKFQNKNYALMGFMEPNADSIRDSLDLTMKWKECFFKVVKIVDDEQQGNVQIEPELVFIKLLSELNLKRLVEAQVTLKALQSLDKRGTLYEYALMAYETETDGKQAEKLVSKALAQNEINAYFYLALYLSKRGKLSEAEAVLGKLASIASMPLAKELDYTVRLSLEASKF